jgi:UDP-2,3-diacylglucosamine hydrolase
LDDNIFFLSDTHFKYAGAGRDEKEKRSLFTSFIETCHGAERIYLLGDIFDFWFEYGNVIPNHYEDVLRALSLLRLSGTGIFMCGGNHDHWIGRYLTDKIGISPMPQETVHELQGHRVKLTHGDTVMPGDYGYKMLKTLIRSRPVIAAARLVHPDILFPFAGLFSRASKGMTGNKVRSYAEKVVKIAEERFFKDGNDTFVMGHIHLPMLKRFGDRTFVILGDWETHFSYLRLEGGVFSLEMYQRDGKTLIDTL